MELVDMPGLGSGEHNRGGSSPSIRNGCNVEVMQSLVIPLVRNQNGEKSSKTGFWGIFVEARSASTIVPRGKRSRVFCGE